MQHIDHHRGVTPAPTPPSTFVVRTRNAVQSHAVMADQSPEGDWVDVGGADAEESHADLFLVSVNTIIQ